MLATILLIIFCPLLLFIMMLGLIPPQQLDSIKQTWRNFIKRIK
ncbi:MULTISPECIES: hypothetical protein [Lactobacillaceae]|nr:MULTISPECIES: hypothetical protein [Lactobacillaceae]